MGRKIVEAMTYKENQVKVKRQSQLTQNSYIILAYYLIHKVLIIILSFFITKDCSEDHMLYKYSRIITIIALVISFNCIFNNFSIDTHVGFWGYNIAFQKMTELKLS